MQLMPITMIMKSYTYKENNMILNETHMHYTRSHTSPMETQTTCSTKASACFVSNHLLKRSRHAFPSTSCEAQKASERETI